MIRRVTLDDAEAITAIYNDYITHSVVTFETQPLRVEDMRQRIASIALHHPYFVYQNESGRVLGYCYAHLWKERAAYRHTWETTIYLAADCIRQGIGTQLMQRLMEECRREGCRVLIACVTAGNTASDALHRRLGYRPVAHFEKVGLKFGHWLDVIDYELFLD